jgi:hypothetical protein
MLPAAIDCRYAPQKILITRSCGPALKSAYQEGRAQQPLGKPTARKPKYWRSR